MIKKLVIATHNPGKAREIAELLHGIVGEVVTAADLNLPEPDETETTFIGNAHLKARAAATATNLPALADDSGFCVAAINGDPGLYSARWAGPNKDFGIAMQAVWDKVQQSGSTNTRAHFICALSLVFPDGSNITVEGRVDGTTCWPPRGDRGFGYDPMFIPDDYDITFGEMEPDHKHAISHRADAFQKMIKQLNARNC